MSPISAIARRLVLSSLVLTLGNACSDSGSDPTNDDTGADVAADGASDVVNIDAADAADLSDDAADGSGTADDVGQGDGSSTSGEIGDECDEDADCASLRCVTNIQGSGVGLCTQPCAENSDCPTDFECVLLVDSGVDAARICLPSTLCIDTDDDGFGFGPDCRGLDCEPDDPDTFPGADELCDLSDNDCDSFVDENVAATGADCETGLFGECAAGRIACIEGVLDCVARTVPIDEVCDGRDNDCDGEIDTDAGGAPLGRTCYDGDVSLMGTGECVGGQQTCIDAAWTACIGQVLPSSEVCDRRDNDCNGRTDETLTFRDYWPDRDGDGFGSATAIPVRACAPPANHVSNANDCDDSDGLVRPGGAENPGDEVDGNCDGAELCFRDGDNDGYRPDLTSVVASADTDCDDSAEAVASDPQGDCDDFLTTRNPAAAEIPSNGVDEDCDGAELCFIDADNDGYRALGDETIEAPSLSCNSLGLARGDEPGNDCDDDSSTAFPGATETIADGIDQDCSGGDRCYIDVDGDGFVVDYRGTVDSVDLDCADLGEAPALAPSGDCDDRHAFTYPGADETIANGVDDDCDRTELCYLDGDNDGYAQGTETIESGDMACNGFREADTATPVDCNDGVATIRPGATEIVGNGIDENCDTEETCYLDADDDGFARGTAFTVRSINVTCDDPGELATVGTLDCNDSVETVYPFAPEVVGDSIDQSCDTRELCYLDNDDDGFARGVTFTIESSNISCAEPRELAAVGLIDCNDSLVGVYPGATEAVGDGIDQNCDSDELCYLDNDNDDYAAGTTFTLVSDDLACDGPRELASVGAVDCDDSVSTVNPGATEVVGDSIDQTCDRRELCYLDNDGDGFARGTAFTIDSSDLACDGVRELAAVGEVDCDDSASSVKPGATEVVADGINQDCVGGDVCYADGDNDGYRTTGTVASADLDCADAFEGVAADPLDCNDGVSGINAGAAEVCGDDIDNNCDGDDDGCSLRGTWSVAAADITYYGEDAADSSGLQVMSAGDFDCDGVSDLIVGAPGDSTSGTDAGAVYVFYGPETSGLVDLRDADAKFTGVRAGHALGTAIDSGADFNGDGCRDIVVGAPGFDSDNVTPEPLIGAAYVIYGTATRYSGVRSIAAGGTFRYRGQNAGDMFGTSVGFVRSYGGTSNADLVVGAPFFDNGALVDAGAAYVILGSSPAGDRANAGTVSAEIWLGVSAGDGLGRWVSSAGNFDSDAAADIVIGAFTRSLDGTPAGAEAGAVYVAYGGTMRGVGLSPATATNVVRFDAPEGDDRVGAMVDGNFDFNGDGFGDLLIKASLSDFNGRPDSGSAWVVYGRSARFTGSQTLQASLGFRIDGELAGDRFSSTVQALGDIDGDGFGEIAVGSIWSDAGAANAGATYVWYGRAGFTGVHSASSRDGFFTGTTANDLSNQCALAGDLNNDGYGDLAIGGPGEDTGGIDAGASYIFFGGPGL